MKIYRKKNGARISCGRDDSNNRRKLFASRLGLNVEYSVIDDDTWDEYGVFTSEEKAIRFADECKRRNPNRSIVVEERQFEGDGYGESDVDDRFVIYEA